MPLIPEIPSSGMQIFITGTQRSGTTLLHHVLESSPAVWSRNELYPIHSWIFDSQKPGSGKRLKETLESMLKVDLSQVPEANAVGEKVALLASAMNSAAKNAKKPYWCLKDPRLSYFLPEYCRHMPNCKFVVLIRDPRAVCRSYLDKKGYQVGRPVNWLTAAERWTNEVAMQLSARDQFEGQIFLVKYEDLIEQFETEVKRLCQFLNIPFSSEMHNYFRRETTISMHDGNLNIRRPPDKSIVDKWRQSMTSKQVQTVESVAFDVMVEAGYIPEHQRRTVPAAKRLAAKIHDRCISEFRWQRSKLVK